MTNLETLTEAGIVPKNYSRLSTQDLAAIEDLTAEEVAAIISSSEKLHSGNPNFTREHAEHGWLY